MKSSDFSAQFPELWASSATSDTITYPIPATTATTGRAALGTGFTTANMTPLAAGGIPPFGQDFNGVLKMLSTSSQNYESGLVPVFSSAFSTSIGGYPLNAIVADATNPGLYWVSTSDSNITVPNTTGSLWSRFGWNQFVPAQSVFGQTSQTYYTPVPDPSTSTSHTTNLSFAAPYDGLVYASSNFNVSNIQPSQCQGLIQISGSSYTPSSGTQVWSDTTLFPMSGSGVMPVKKGDTITVTSSYNLPPASSTFATVGQTITYTFTPSGF